MIELFLFGIVLGLLSSVLIGLLVSAYYQYKRNK
uniref:Cytochrome b6/f complex subunit V n=1 Tax=Partenskyella glossopodia TaxID=552666 RepID=A0A140JZP6_9EUKA|nr:cytochrome b6/f complex subunit V [Partenskyella glossopodia]BAU62573.1 cytochrome b6/f complex subunit V [Partenskyella glossopodia]